MSDDLDCPDGWKRTTLGELGRYINGRGFKSTEWSTEGRPIIRIQDLTGSRQQQNHFSGPVEPRHVVQPGDLLVSWSATLGAYIWDGPEALLNQHIFKVESRIDKRFHYHLMRHRLAALQEGAHGSGMVHVTKGVFDGTEAVIPEDTEAQQSIAAALDRLDELRDSVDRHASAAQDVMETFRRVILMAACTGRLTARWREEHPEAVSVDDALSRMSVRKKRGKPALEQPLGLALPDLPSTYVVSTVRQASILLEYGTSEKADSSGEGMPVLRMGNIQDGRLELSDLKFVPVNDEIERLTLRRGDLLFNRTNSPELVGKSAVYDEKEVMTFASYLIRVRFDDDVADPRFVAYWLNSAWGRAWAAQVKTDGVSQSNINGTKLGLMPLPLPPVEEQRAIVAAASEMLQIAQQVLERIQAIKRQTERSRKAVLAKAFRGELLARTRAISGARAVR
jgi:type I restriction enzyme S subunit